jgi:hypothetical protein
MCGIHIDDLYINFYQTFHADHPDFFNLCRSEKWCYTSSIMWEFIFKSFCPIKISKERTFIKQDLTEILFYLNPLEPSGYYMYHQP